MKFGRKEKREFEYDIDLLMSLLNIYMGKLFRKKSRQYKINRLMNDLANFYNLLQRAKYEMRRKELLNNV